MKQWTNGKIEINTIEGEINEEVLEGLKEQKIYWSDSLCKHFFMMFDTARYWVESIKINNELTVFDIIVTEKTKLKSEVII
jgi:hypothetical protein